MEANETEGKIERFLNTQIVLNFKTVKQFAMLAAIFGVYSVVLLFSGSKVTGVAGGLQGDASATVLLHEPAPAADRVHQLV